jgi:hypothetical protein
MMRVDDVVTELELDVLDRAVQVLQQLLFGVGNDGSPCELASGGGRTVGLLQVCR